ncbi:MAG: carcinine hydrolase/isopenicillin-N N-acyltransferase family protein [Spirochaetota bacterium]
MCDTLYSAPGGSQGSCFAKNSDRHPEEPQALCLVPARATAPHTAFGGLSFDAPDAGYSYVLSKPSWMPGGEMGVNTRGLAVGNEAVFSRFKAKKDGVLGMALLRATLASAGSAAEARDFICSFVETHDQGGNGAYKGSLVYSNSFIVADPRGAFVVETAGRRWAWKSAGSAATISNAYSIVGDAGGMDSLSRSELETGGGTSWRRLVEDRLYLAFTRGDSRRACTAATLAGEGQGGLDTMLKALRDHGKKRSDGRDMGAPCVHGAGFPVKSTATASLVVEYIPPGSGAGSGSTAVVWFSGTPHPCLSLFAPIVLSSSGFIPLWTGYAYEEDSKESYARWESSRLRAQLLGGALRSSDPAFMDVRDSLQGRLHVEAIDSYLKSPGAEGLARARANVNTIMADWDSFLDSPGAGGSHT